MASSSASSPPSPILTSASSSSSLRSPYVGVGSPIGSPSQQSQQQSQQQHMTEPLVLQLQAPPGGNNTREGENYLVHQLQHQQGQGQPGRGGNKFVFEAAAGEEDANAEEREQYPYQEGEGGEGDGGDQIGGSITSVSSQEEMISLLPEKNASYGFRAREASLTCRFRRRAPKGTGDKWKTIGIGGSRVSHPDLAGHLLTAVNGGHRRPSEEEFAALAAQHQLALDRQQQQAEDGGLLLVHQGGGSPRSLNGGGAGGVGRPPRHGLLGSRSSTTVNGGVVGVGHGEEKGSVAGKKREAENGHGHGHGRVFSEPPPPPPLPPSPPPQQQQQLAAVPTATTKEAPQRGKGHKAVPDRRHGEEEEEESLPAWASHAVGALVHDLLERGEALGSKLVKAVDDAILGSTAPFVALYLSLAYGLPRATNRVQFEKDLRMPLPRKKGDKTRHSLSFMILHPADSGRRRRYPTILVRNPYGRLTFFYTFYLFAQRGYNVVVQDVRGRGESTGVFDCIHDEEDAQATLEWITSQPWYSPEHGIGCLGMSYNGYCLYSTFKDPAKAIHPAVRAVVPINTTSRLSTMSYRDGPLHLELIIRWSGYLWTLTRDTTSLLKLGLSLLNGLQFLGYFGLCDHPAFTRAIRHLPVHEITKEITGISLTRGGMFYYPPDCDFCQARCASGALRKDLPPAQIHASWYDIFLVDSLFDYTTLVAKGNPDARIMISGDYHVKRYFNYAVLVKEAIAHFRRFCRRDPQPYKGDEKVTLQILHHAPGLEWVGFPCWPPKQTQPLPALLSADGTLHLQSPSLAPSSLQPGTRGYTYFPADPTPSIGGNGIGFIDAGEKDQARLEAREKTVGDLLVYTSPPLEADTYVIGTPTATLWVRCLSPRAHQADFVVRLCDVDGKGKSVNICDGVRRVGDLAALERDATGEWFKVEVEVYPTAARFRKGHRLRVHVASAGFIRWERNTMAYGYPSFIPVKFEVAHGDVGGPSALTIPVVPAEALTPSTMKSCA